MQSTVGSRSKFVRIRIVPADDGAADSRELGVVLSDLAFEPRQPGS